MMMMMMMMMMWCLRIYAPKLYNGRVFNSQIRDLNILEKVKEKLPQEEWNYFLQVSSHFQISR